MEEVNQPLVSVIIPTYNRIRTLPVSINSVLNQTYQNLEVIVMDDGSEDGTEEYVKSIADKRVRYVKSKYNMGPSAARNRGAELARGEYIAFQDSDDEWLPDKLEKQMERMLSDQELSLVYCEFGLYREGKLLMQIPSRNVPYEQKCGDLFSYLLLYPLISTQTIVVKREAFLSEKGFDETLKSYEDFEFTLRFSRKYRIGFVQESLVKVYSSPGSVNKRFAERIRTQFFMVREMLEPLRERDLLWEKLGIILHEAETRLCHDTFIEEIGRLSEQLLSDGERENAALFLEKVRSSKEIFLMKMSIRDNLPQLKVKILKVYTELFESRRMWSTEQQEMVKKVTNALFDFRKVFEIPEEMSSRFTQIGLKLEEGGMPWEEQLYLLADIVELLEMQEKIIADQQWGL